MSISWQSWGWLLKLLFAAIILLAIGWRFAVDLNSPKLHELTWRPQWLALSAGLYLFFLWTSCLFWRRLLNHFGAAPSLWVASRAYFVSQLGKYVPGKAWALLLRGGMVRGPNLRMGLAILTSFYEVLTTMAAGGICAAVAFVLAPPDLGLPVPPAMAGLILVGLCGVSLLPAIFNRIVARLARKLQSEDAGPLPKIDIVTLGEGLAITACGWCVLGISIWAGLAAVLPEAPELTIVVWLRCLGAIGLAYVGGFVVVFLPGGFGAREGALLLLLAFAGSDALIAAAVLLMRVAWTIAELAVIAALYPWRSPGALSTK